MGELLPDGKVHIQRAGVNVIFQGDKLMSLCGRCGNPMYEKFQETTPGTFEGITGEWKKFLYTGVIFETGGTV